MLSREETTRVYDTVTTIRAVSLETHMLALDHLNKGGTAIHNQFDSAFLTEPDQNTLYIDMNLCVMHEIAYPLYQPDKYLRD